MKPINGAPYSRPFKEPIAALIGPQMMRMQQQLPPDTTAEVREIAAEAFIDGATVVLSTLGTIVARQIPIPVIEQIAARLQGEIAAYHMARQQQAAAEQSPKKPE